MELFGGDVVQHELDFLFGMLYAVAQGVQDTLLRETIFAVIRAARKDDVEKVSRLYEENSQLLLLEEGSPDKKALAGLAWFSMGFRQTSIDPTPEKYESLCGAVAGALGFEYELEPETEHELETE